MNGNGSGRLAYWIMGAMLVVLTTLAGGAAHSFDTRLSSVEATRVSRTDTLGQFEADIRILREQLCRLEEKVDNLREDVTRKRVYRRPCP